MKYCSVLVKLLFFEEVAKKLNEFLLVFQTDKPMAPFLMETLEDLINTLTGNSFAKTFVTSLAQKWQN